MQPLRRSLFSIAGRPALSSLGCLCARRGPRMERAASCHLHAADRNADTLNAPGIELAMVRRPTRELAQICTAGLELSASEHCGPPQPFLKPVSGWVYAT